jgi:uroporphyrinogen decarboxylase
MDPRERVLTALHGGEPDRVPCTLGFFAQSLFGATDADEYFGTDVRFVDFAPPAGQDGFLEYLESLPPGVHVGSAAQVRTYHEWGYHPEREEARAPRDGSSGRAERQPGGGAGTEPWRGMWRGAGDGQAPAPRLRGLGKRVSRLLPAITDRQRHAHLQSEIERLHARGLAVAGSPPHLGGELFESAWRLRGFELFMKDLVKRPELVDYLLDQLEAMATESARILGRAGVDVLILDDDVAYKDGLLISPATWRRYFKPRLARIIAAAREAAAQQEAGAPAVLYHSDGDFTALLRDLVEIGVDAINPVAPDCMDAASIRSAFGPRLAMWGTVGSAWDWDQGDPEAVRREVEARVHSVGRAGLILCPAYDLDYTPRENVAAFLAAVREFG